MPRRTSSYSSRRLRTIALTAVLVLYALSWCVVTTDTPAGLASWLHNTGLYPTSSAPNTSSTTVSEDAEVWHVQVLDIHDGDTLHIRDMQSHTTYKCRLIGIDTPELDGEYRSMGIRSRDALRQMFAANHEAWVSFDAERYDDYHRLLVYLWTAPPSDQFSDSVNYQMVSRGLAEALKVKPNTAHSTELFDAERTAHAEGTGFWSEQDFTKRHRYSR